MGSKKNPVPRTTLPPKRGTAQRYITGDEAAKALGIKRQSLYAYVSRGLVRSIAQPGRRERLYYREDIERLEKRMGGRGGMPETVEAALSWGQPVLHSAITELRPEGPFYRGRSSIALAQAGRSFESVAELLWTGMDLPQVTAWDPTEIPAGLAARLGAAVRGVEGLSCLRLMAIATPLVAVLGNLRPDFERGSTVGDARQLIGLYCRSLGLMGPKRRFVTASRPDMPIAELFLQAVAGPVHRDAVFAVNFAFILCADHELSPATLSARIAASAGAELRACLLAAIGTHSGMFLASGCDQSEAFLRAARDPQQMHARMLELERSGGRIPGYNIKAYPEGDPRARQLLELAAGLGPKGRQIGRLVAQVEEVFDLRPSLEVGLVALAAALGLPAHSASAIWSLGRCAGWTAHVIEQRHAAFMVRPRARYVGPSPD